MVALHKDTDSQGRWSIHTDVQNFRHVTDTIRDGLANLAHQIQVEQSLAESPYEHAPSVAFRNPRLNDGLDNDDDSTDEGSFQTYLSACTSVYTVDDGSFEDDGVGNHRPPFTNSRPATQAWTNPLPIDTVVATSTSTTPSQVSHEEYDRLKNSHDRLLDEMAELKTRFAQMVELQRQAVET